MKIMRPDWRSAGLPRGLPPREHLAEGKHIPPQPPPVAREPDQETLMQWTTPTATDFRFGFEITMYVSAR
jgi:coenzyme PQQ precursor peptide PqqA